MLADGLGFLGGTIIFILYGKHAPQFLLGFGCGSTLLAMFMRVGGGIYTKAAGLTGPPRYQPPSGNPFFIQEIG